MLLIFTDLDGTLLNPDDYQYEPALPVLGRLKDHRVPVIAVTSKTRREVEALYQVLELRAPFITENGSGVFIPMGDRRFVLPDTEIWNDYHLLRLGCTYDDARNGLQTISAKLGASLSGFGDLSVDEIIQRTGLAADDAKLAKTRDFTEPFVTPQTIPSDQLADAIQAAGFQVVRGDRFSHLIGKQAGKGTASRLLIQAYQTANPGRSLTTIGLGNSPNDRDMLEVVDIPIVVPGHNGPHPGLVGSGWQVAPAVGSQGWAIAVNDWCDRLLNESAE
ncbi:MAG: HAD-IIB family hydrolase [Elainellaceae cyanobacterium]